MIRTCIDCGEPFVTSTAKRCIACLRKRKYGAFYRHANENRCRACGAWTLLHDGRRCGSCHRAGRPELAIYLSAEERNAICYLVVGMTPRPLRTWFSTVQGVRR